MQRYYKQIHDMPPLSEQEMNAHLAEESRVRAAGGRPGAQPVCASVARTKPALLRQQPEHRLQSATLGCWKERARKDILPQTSRHKLPLT